MTATATAAQVRAYYKACDYQVRISRDGHVTYRHDPDRYFGWTDTWLDGRWVADYRVDESGNVSLR